MTKEQDRAEYRRRYVQELIKMGISGEEATIAVDIAFHVVSQVDDRLKEAIRNLGDPHTSMVMLGVAAKMLTHLAQHVLELTKEATERNTGVSQEDALIKMMLLMCGVEPKEGEAVVLYARDDADCECENCAMARELAAQPETRSVEIGEDMTAFIAPKDLCNALYAKHSGATVQ